MKRLDSPVRSEMSVIHRDLPTSDSALGWVRRFMRTSRQFGVKSIVYYYSHRFSSARSYLPYLHFETGKVASRHGLPEEHAEVLSRCYEMLINLGRPIIMSRWLPAFAEAEPRLTKEIVGAANDIGIFDQFMVPVFGPYDINGVISFGFAETIDTKNKEPLHRLESVAASLHNRLVRHFRSEKSDITLSNRELEVLEWIARGKSNYDIASILGISSASVDTYARRIFEKMGVNSRVSAAITGVTTGLVKPD